MIRREFIASLAGILTGWPLAAGAQQAGRTVRLASLSGGSEAGTRERDACFYDELTRLGWIEGHNIMVDRRWAAGKLGSLPALAAELVALHPDVLMTSGTPSAQAMQQASRGIPMVFNMVSDPVASGIVTNLARPTANVTGVSNFFPAMIGKLLELIQTVSGARRFAVLYDPNNPGKRLDVRMLQEIGQQSTLAFDSVPVRGEADVAAAFETMERSPPQAIIVLVDAVTISNQQRIVDGVNKLRVPAIYQERSFVEAGGLMSYALNYCAHFHRAAVYVDKILRGEKPSALPVEQPSTFELTLNVKTAKTLGIAIPPTILAVADNVIE
jgi:putative ABC transport system substrate-binding protein